MRCLLFLALLFSAPAYAQGIYIQSGAGGSASFSTSSQNIGYEGRGVEVNAFGAGVGFVIDRAQVSISGVYSSLPSDASVYGVTALVGLLPLHQHQGAPLTLALNGGIGFSVLTNGFGVTSSLVQSALFAPEIGVAIPVGSGVSLVPSATLAVDVPFGSDAPSTTVAAGGALGLSFGFDDGFTLVLEPGYARVDGVSTLAFSVRLFKG